jgi:hypothetical protein
MNVPKIRCFLCLKKGDVLKFGPTDPMLATARQETQLYLPIESIPPRLQYQWLDGFVREIGDDDLKPRLEEAINGKGAFRRFKNVLQEFPDLRRRWFSFRDAEVQTYAEEWVYEHGLNPENLPEWKSSESEPVVAGKVVQPDSSRVEALRDFIIAWFDKQELGEVVGPLVLEELAQEISTKFEI